MYLYFTKSEKLYNSIYFEIIIYLKKIEQIRTNLGIFKLNFSTNLINNLKKSFTLQNKNYDNILTKLFRSVSLSK